MQLNREFNDMSSEDKVTYLINNLHDLPDHLAEEGVDVLAKAGETEYAVVLARDKGMIQKAIDVLVDAGDYLWAGLIAKNAGMAEESERLYREGLQYYVEMEMYGRAVSAATVLKLSPDEIDDLFRKGIEAECRDMDLSRARAMIDSAMESLEIALLGRDDEIAQQIMEILQKERDKFAGVDDDEKSS